MTHGIFQIYFVIVKKLLPDIKVIGNSTNVYLTGNTKLCGFMVSMKIIY